MNTEPIIFRTSKIPALLLTSIGLATTSQAASIIYEASDTNTTQITNTSNDNGALTLVGDTVGSTLVVTNGNGSLNNGGFGSTDNLNTLAGVPLTAADTLIYTITIDSITGTPGSNSVIRANGLTFGIAPDLAFGSFAATSGLAVSLRPDNNAVLLSEIGATTATTQAFNVNEDSIEDGFTVTLTANSSGYTFSFVGLLDGNTGTLADISGTFSGTEFIDSFSNSHFFATTQRFSDPDPTVTTFSEASIEIIRPEVVPEPSSSVLLLSSLAVLMMRRQRS